MLTQEEEGGEEEGEEEEEEFECAFRPPPTPRATPLGSSLCDTLGWFSEGPCTIPLRARSSSHGRLMQLPAVGGRQPRGLRFTER